MLEKIFPKIHNEGYKFIVIFVFATIILYFIHGFLGFIGLVLSIWCYYFFRDPERISIGDEDYLTSPADGVVLQVLETNGFHLSLIPAIQLHLQDLLNNLHLQLKFFQDL